MVQTAGRLLTLGDALGAFMEIGALGGERIFELTIRGPECIVAIGAARLGANVTWFGRVGPGALGALIERRLISENVETITPGNQSRTQATPCADLDSSCVGSEYLPTASTMSNLAPEDIPEARVRTADILHVTGITPALGPSARATVLETIEIARHCGILVSFDVHYSKTLWSFERAIPTLRDVARGSDVVFSNMQEAELITGEESSTAVQAARNLDLSGCQEVIVHDPIDGGYRAIIGGIPFTIPGAKGPARRGNRPGQAFVAAYLSDHLDGAGIRRRFSTAMKAESFASAIHNYGRLPSLSDLDGVEPWPG